MKLFKVIGNFFGSLYFLLFMISWPVGIYHSYQKHKSGDVVLSVLVFPFGMYRSIEMLWHNDGIDWESKLSGDMSSIIFIFSQITIDKRNRIQIERDIEVLNSKISKYPEDKIELLKKGTKNYLNYSDFFEKDVGDYYNNVLISKDKTTNFNFSDSSIYYKNLLVKEFRLNEEPSLNYNADSILKAEINKVDISNIDVNTYNETLKSAKQKRKEEKIKIYNQIFNE